MAFGHHKLIVGKELTAGQATSYLAEPQSTGDYYSESDHAFMRWVANAHTRAELGLHQDVELWKVESLLNGQHPISRDLLRQWGPNGTMVGGHDITLSPATKSVSVLWALADHDLRQELEIMTGQAADSSIGGMLKFVPLIRERYGPGPNDVHHVTAENYVGVQAFHTTARRTEAKPGTPDPDLHLHTVMFGALDEKGQIKAIDSLKIRQHRSEIDGSAMARLAEMLRQEGFQIERKLIRGQAPGDKYSRPETWTGDIKYASYEVAGIPQSLLDAMSARTKEIANLKLKYKEDFGREAEGPGWERYVVKHRGPKSTKTSAELRADWEAEAAEHGFSAELVDQLKAEAAARKAAGIPERGIHSDEAKQLREEILADLTRSHAIVPRRALDKLAMVRAVGLLDPNVARFVVNEMIGDGDILETTDGTRVTTLATLALEQRTTAAAQKLLDLEASRAADPAKVDEEIRRQADSGDPFDEAQEQAIRVAVSGAHLVSISGPAGTGKGYASRSMVNVWHDQGRRVIALAIAGRTSQQAQVDSGADEQYTLAGLEARLDHVPNFGLRASDVLLIDEAAMISHSHYPPVLEAALAVGAKVVQVGDDKQLSPVEAGGLWTVAHHMAAELGNTAELVTVRRARDPMEAQAWTDLRNGEVEKSLSWYADQGRLHLYDNRPEMIHGIVNNWFEREDDRGVMVIDTTNSERDMANRIAQAKRLEAGEIGEQALRLENEREIHVGDSILFGERPTQLNRDLNAYGPRIENGTVATVLALQDSGREYLSNQLAAERGLKGNDLIERTGGHQYDAERKAAGPGPPDVAVVVLHEPGGDRVVTVDTSVPAELAYARHVYKAQGMSAETAQVGTGTETSLENLYVMTSRSRGGSEIHALRSEVEDLGADPDHLDARERQAAQRGESQREAQAVASSTEPQTEAAEETSPAAGAEHAVREAHAPINWAEINAGGDKYMAEVEARRGADAETPAEVVSGAEVHDEPVRQTAELPDGATPWADTQAQILTDQLVTRQAQEKVTIREMADHTKSQAKEAASTSKPEWGQPTQRQTTNEPTVLGNQADDQARRPLYRDDHRFNDRRMGDRQIQREGNVTMRQKVTAEERRQQARERIDARGQEITEATAEEAKQAAKAPPAPAVMPARKGAETVARGWLREGRTAEGLGLYESQGQLTMVQNPELHAAQKAAATGGLVIAQDKEAQARIQKHLNDLQPKQGQPDSQPFPAADKTPTGLQHKAQVLTAAEVYRARAEHREAWTAEARAEQAKAGRPEATGHLVEPGAIERATVVVSDPKDAHSVVRGTSAAAEAHLVTGRPDPATGAQVVKESERFSAQQRGAAKVEAQRQAAEAKAQAERTAQQRSQERTAGHQAQAQGDAGQHQARSSATQTHAAQQAPAAQHQEASR